MDSGIVCLPQIYSRTVQLANRSVCNWLAGWGWLLAKAMPHHNTSGECSTPQKETMVRCTRDV